MYICRSVVACWLPPLNEKYYSFSFISQPAFLKSYHSCQWLMNSWRRLHRYLREIATPKTGFGGFVARPLDHHDPEDPWSRAGSNFRRPVVACWFLLTEAPGSSYIRRNCLRPFSELFASLLLENFCTSFLKAL